MPLDGVVGATEAEVKGPDGVSRSTPVIDGLATFYGPRVGYYDVAAKSPTATVAQIELAANLASPMRAISRHPRSYRSAARTRAPEAFAISTARRSGSICYCSRGAHRRGMDHLSPPDHRLTSRLQALRQLFTVPAMIRLAPGAIGPPRSRSGLAPRLLDRRPRQLTVARRRRGPIDLLAAAVAAT